MYRASTGDLSYVDDGPARGERWDRDRFERMRGGRSRKGSVAGADDYDHYRFREHEQYPGLHRDVDYHRDVDRRGPRVAERTKYREDERYGPSPRRSRAEIFDEPTPSEVANRALAPYRGRRKSVVGDEIDIAIRRPARPGYHRRQSSLDTYDRRPLPRSSEHEREEWRPPTNLPIPLPIRERRRSPPQRYHDDDIEEIRYREYERELERERERERDRERDRELRGRPVEEYREVEVRREKSTRRAKSRARSRARSIAASSARSSSTSSFEEVVKPIGKKGKTRMPKRLVKKEAIIELGYPFEEEEDFIIVRRALEKEHIDEIIKLSESYKESEKTTYVFADTKSEIVEAAPPPPPPPVAVAPLPPPPPPVVPVVDHNVHYAPSVRSASPGRHEVYEERVVESNHIGGPLTVLVPEGRHAEERRVTRVERDTRTERDIKEEIRALEAERRMLKYERDDREYEFVERERREPRRDVVRVEKDRKVRREPNPKVVAAMMATLS